MNRAVQTTPLPPDSDFSSKVPRRRWRIAWLLGFGVLVNYFDRVNLSVSHAALVTTLASRLLHLATCRAHTTGPMRCANFPSGFCWTSSEFGVLAASAP